MSNNTLIKQYKRKITSPEHLFTHSPFSVVTMVARIKGKVTETMLKRAVVKIQQRHTLLRVRIIADEKHSHWFTSKGVQEIPVEVVARQAENDWIHIHTEAVKVPFEFDTRPAIRFILVQSPTVSEVIILCHHIICDGLSLAYLARDLLVHLGDPARKVEILPDPQPISLENFPEDVKQSRLVKFMVQRMNQKWAEQQVVFDKEDYHALNQAYWDHYNHSIISGELSADETTALVARCKKAGVSVTTALAAAFSGAGSYVQEQQPYHNKTVIATSLRNPLPHNPGEAMGYYAGGVELTLKYNHQQDFWDNARNYQKKIRPKLNNKNMFGEVATWLYLDPSLFEAFNFKKLGGLVPADSPRHDKLSNFSEQADVALKILKRDGMDSLENKRLGPAITNLGRLNFPSSYGDLELDRLIMQPGGAFPLSQVNMVVGAVTCSGKLSLVVEYAEQAVDSATMTKIKDKAMAFLHSS